jgi:hypothetical protein
MLGHFSSGSCFTRFRIYKKNWLVYSLCADAGGGGEYADRLYVNNVPLLVRGGECICVQSQAPLLGCETRASTSQPPRVIVLIFPFLPHLRIHKLDCSMVLNFKEKVQCLPYTSKFRSYNSKLIL